MCLIYWKCKQRIIAASKSSTVITMDFIQFQSLNVVWFVLNLALPVNELIQMKSTIWNTDDLNKVQHKMFNIYFSVSLAPNKWMGNTKLGYCTYAHTYTQLSMLLYRDLVSKFDHKLKPSIICKKNGHEQRRKETKERKKNRISKLQMVHNSGSATTQLE